MPAQLDKKLHQLQFFWFSPLWLFNGFPMTLLFIFSSIQRCQSHSITAFIVASLWPREKRTGFTFNKNAWSDQMLLCLAPAFFVAWGSHPRPVWGFTCLAGARKNYSFFFMFSTDEIYDTVLILCCCSTSVFRGDIKLCHWVSKGQCFSK